MDYTLSSRIKHLYFLKVYYKQKLDLPFQIILLKLDWGKVEYGEVMAYPLLFHCSEKYRINIL